jgi:hypothetical protein
MSTPPAERSLAGRILVIVVGIVVVALIAVVVALAIPGVWPGSKDDSNVHPVCESSWVDAFFSARATASVEEVVQDQLRDYAHRLRSYVCDKPESLGEYENPMAGMWNGDAGYFSLTDTTFYWFMSMEDLGDNYYAGEYRYLPGCEVDSGFALDKDGSPCFSIFMKYSELMIDGLRSYELFYGVFQVTHLESSVLEIHSQRSGGTFRLELL